MRQRKSPRPPGFNYAQNATYFVTICTKNRQNHFGEIDKNQKMIPSPIGHSAIKCWQEIPQHYPFVLLDEFVLMPNHIHGILTIKKSDRDATSCVHNKCVHKECIRNDIKNKFGPQSDNLGAIIRGFKIGVTKFARKNTDILTVWQSRYHDSKIEDKEALMNIRKYIQNNVKEWKNDEFNSF